MRLRIDELAARTGTTSRNIRAYQARGLLHDRYGIDHATLQVEPNDHSGCDELSW